MVIRQIKDNETELLKDFLYEAIFVPDGELPPPRDIIAREELAVYYEGFGKESADICVVADDNGKIAGAAWSRIMNDYGHIDDDTPSLAVSLYEEYRGIGIGTEMMTELLSLLAQQGFHKASLAVQKRNRAAEMYKKLGFETAGENDEEFIMVIDTRNVKKVTRDIAPKIKTLYVSDLDGTLLRSDEKTSVHTNEVINKLTSEGMLFSYATARSLVTAKKVTQGLDAKIPLIVYNGAFIIDNVTGEILLSNYFDDSVKGVLDRLFAKDIYPIVYSYIDGKERFSFVPSLISEETKEFTDTRQGDERLNTVDDKEDLKKGNIFYITCIDDPDKLRPVYEELKDVYHCVYQIDIYTGSQWLEIMPAAASKANAVRQLKELYDCERVTSFGDGKNDIDMFMESDECYAVANADEELKQNAAEIIDSNNNDGVANKLLALAEEVRLVPVRKEELKIVWRMQTIAFADMLAKYKDYDTSPANDRLDNVIKRAQQAGSVYYFIVTRDRAVGVIRVIDRKDGSRKRISPIWIQKEFRNKGYAQKAIMEAERIHGSDNWCLDTILQEKGNIYLYEKLGYHRTGKSEKINDNMDIVFLEKD